MIERRTADGGGVRKTGKILRVGAGKTRVLTHLIARIDDGSADRGGDGPNVCGAAHELRARLNKSVLGSGGRRNVHAIAGKLAVQT